MHEYFYCIFLYLDSKILRSRIYELELVMKVHVTLLSLSMLCITACTHTPSSGEKMLTHSEEARKLGEQWTKGEDYILASKKLEKNGNKLINQGNKHIAQGNKLISKGDGQVKKGSDMVDLSRTQFKEGQRLQQESTSQFIEKYPGKLE
jgi:hypothetical protein